MPKQAIVIGLGQFGLSLTRSLARRGVEVVAVDLDMHRVQEAAPHAARALCFDSCDESALAELDPGRRDLAVCAIGDEAREASIITTALLRQLGAPLIVGRATDPLHERILRLIGAHDVVNPERAFGERLAARLSLSGVVDEVPLGPDLVITEVHAPASFVGRTLVDLALPRKHGVVVAAVRRDEGGVSTLAIPRPDEALRRDDVMVLVARPGVVAALLGRM